MLNIKGRQAPLGDPDGGCINLPHPLTGRALLSLSGFKTAAKIKIPAEHILIQQIHAHIV